jgi:hypothetical protein
MLTGTGCSVGKKSSKSGGDTSYSSSLKKYDLDDFTFEVSEDLDVKDTKELDGKIYDYIFKGDGFSELEVMNSGNSLCTAETYIKLLERSTTRSNEKNGKNDEFESAKLDISGFNAAEIFIVNKDSEYDQGEAYVSLTTEGYHLLISAKYDLDNKDRVKQLMEEIAKTVKYTGDFRLPTEPQTYDCDLFSITAGPEWKLWDGTADKDKERGIKNIKMRYYYAQDLDHYYYPMLTIYVVPEDETTTIDTLIENQCERYDESKYQNNAERGKDEILGYQAETFSYDVSVGDIDMRSKIYYFCANGFIYAINTAVNISAEETNMADIQTLLDNLTIKQLSEEEIEKKKQEIEAARYKSYTFQGASFKLDSDLKTRDDLDSSQTYANFSGYHTDLRISVDNNSVKTADKAAQRTYDENANNEDVKIDKVTVGGNEFSCVSWTVPDLERKIEVYHIKVGDKLWTFDFGMDESYCEEGKDIIQHFLESLEFGNE